MLNINPICKRFEKLPAHFKDNFSDAEKASKLFDYEMVNKCKQLRIHESLIPDFLWWLSNGAKGCKEIRQMLPTQGVEKTLEFARRYKKI